LPLFGEGNWVPSNNNNKPICNAPDASVTDPEARWPGPRATSVSGDILIHPAVGSQRTEAESWGLCVFLGGAVFPSNIMWPGPRPTSVPSGIWMGPAVWPVCMGRKFGGVFLARGEAGSPCNNVAWADAYPARSGILMHATVWPQYMGQKWWCCTLPFWGERGPRLTQSRLG